MTKVKSEVFRVLDSGERIMLADLEKGQLSSETVTSTNNRGRVGSCICRRFSTSFRTPKTRELVSALGEYRRALVGPWNQKTRLVDQNEEFF